jgi:hypothetical protein
MHRGAELAVRLRHELSFQHAVSDADNWLRGRAHVLLDRQGESRWDWSVLDPFCG